jgi:hypothetical protein
MSLQVIRAAYGALKDGNQDNTEASDVTGNLQFALDNSANGVVTINNANMGADPAPGVVKHFGAIVKNEQGNERAFACQENQTIAFEF